MRVLAGALGGTALGMAVGWFLPLAFTQGSPEYGGQALLAFRALGAGVLGITGLIVGGALSMKYARGDRPGPVQAARGGGQRGRNVPHGRR